MSVKWKHGDDHENTEQHRASLCNSLPPNLCVEINIKLNRQVDAKVCDTEFLINP
jgi:hypothetical protein